jgi:hypothetical protein
MPSTKLSSARNIAKNLRPSEDIIDASILRNVQLVASIIEARLETGVAAEVGHDAFMSASAGLAALRRARDHVVNCHRQLAATRDSQGLSPHAVGCTLDKVLPKAAAEASVAFLPQARSA